VVQKSGADPCKGSKASAELGVISAPPPRRYA